MKRIVSLSEMRAWSRERRREGKRVGFVPTMGYLHRGHVSLVEQARVVSDAVAVSIFVNPLQFGPSEDLAAYPRDLERDAAMLEAAQTDVLFIPDASEVYPADFATTVEVSGVSEGLCGASRPGHFKGVATVVLKLFNIVEPDVACFGKKDFQQLRVLQQMVRDLNLPIEVLPGETVREPDGLAMSSRNAYLSDTERRQALAISHALGRARELAQSGTRESGAIVEAIRQVLRDEAPQGTVDYIQVVDANTLQDVARLQGHVLVALAFRLGRARLIDNTELHL